MTHNEVSAGARRSTCLRSRCRDLEYRPREAKELATLLTVEELVTIRAIWKVKVTAV